MQHMWLCVHAGSVRATLQPAQRVSWVCDARQESNLMCLGQDRGGPCLQNVLGSLQVPLSSSVDGTELQASGFDLRKECSRSFQLH